ncbi:MAG: exopolyphosphatase / guanosine-5-triphosphate,3-diphosphate pyrophosphatase [Verrucomicrobiota bacterium]|jgi:exopolyphosphatase/guanosine-5'-triphosphate,3'-diphosphate pyrophosphatase
MNQQNPATDRVMGGSSVGQIEAAAREEALVLMREMENKPFHVQHVARLALELFDPLAVLHGLGAQERLWLEAAAYLHDIGHQFGVTGEGHHKESARMIRERHWTNFTPREVEVIAQVARYHRKAIPELSHEEFRALDDASRLAVQRLGALLRLADSLDRSHQQLVKSARVEIRPNQLVFHLEAGGIILREIKAAQSKGDLAVAVFQRDLVFMVGDDVLCPPTVATGF